MQKVWHAFGCCRFDTVHATNARKTNGNIKLNKIFNDISIALSRVCQERLDEPSMLHVEIQINFRNLFYRDFERNSLLGPFAVRTTSFDRANGSSPATHKAQQSQAGDTLRRYRFAA